MKMETLTILTFVLLKLLVFGFIMEFHYKNHTCIRECRTNDVRTCEYDFILEYYFTLTKACYNCPFNLTDCERPHCVTAGGLPRVVVVANRMLPGPAIHVCKNDVVKVNVHNRLDTGEGTTIHWHGQHQRNHQHMDGAPMVTQCPIPIESTFQYKFPAATVGTHFWHSHIGFQRSDGLFGAFIVREPENKHMYDFDLPEHTILMTDWSSDLSIKPYLHDIHAGGANNPATLLINGKGRVKEFEDSKGTKAFTPYEVFKVTIGRRYRFRVISNGVMNCPIQFSIDNHTLEVMASDGNPFERIDVESFNIFAGERYDFVLYADQQINNFWIRTRGEAQCGASRAYQQAILRYDGSAESEPAALSGYDYGYRNGKKLNPWNKKETDQLIPVSRLEALIPDDESLREIPDKKFYLPMDFNAVNNFKYQDPTYYPIQSTETMQMPSFQISHISSVNPPVPLLTQFKEVPNDALCNADSVKVNCKSEFCECAHLLKVGLGDVVELVLIDEGKNYNSNHPMHLHGYSFRVVGIEKLNVSTTLEEVMELDRQGLLQRNLTHAVAKDSVAVPDGGYTIMRFHANNPGFWLFHCHIAFHQNIGMWLVIQVGELHQMPKLPKNFPRCGKWEFTGYETEKPQTQCTSGATIIAVSISIITLLVCILRMIL